MSEKGCVNVFSLRARMPLQVSQEGGRKGAKISSIGQRLLVNFFYKLSTMLLVAFVTDLYLALTKENCSRSKSISTECLHCKYKYFRLSNLYL